MSKNINIIKGISDGYNQNFKTVEETVKNKYPQYTLEAQNSMVQTEREKLTSEYKDKVSLWSRNVQSQKDKIQKDFYGQKYPNRASDNSILKEVGATQKQNSLLFLNFSNEAGILQEIKQAFDLGDTDYASSIIDGYRLKLDIYTRDEINNLTQDEVSRNMDKLNRSLKYLKEPETFPLLSAIEKIESEKFPKLKELKTELRDYETEESILKDFSKQLEAGSNYLRSAELFPFLTEPERLQAFEHSSSNQIEEIAFRRLSAEKWKQSNPNA
jgi:hypothetical protein